MSTIDSASAENIPVADGIPLIGSALAMLKNPLEFLKEQRRKHGNVFRVHAGPRSMLILSGTEINRFMSEEGKECFVSEGFWGRITEYWGCPHMLTALDGEQHINDRRSLKSTMSKRVADDRQKLLTDIIRKTVDSYLSKSAIVSVRALTRTLTNSELYYLLTDEFPELDDRTAKSMAEYQRITFNVLSLGKWPRLMLWTPQYLYHKSISERFVRQLIHKYENNPPESGWFKVVLDLQRQPGRTPGDLLANFFAPFWAGLDTLGASLTFLIQELVLDSGLLASASAELESAIAHNEGEIPAPGQLRSLPILFGLCMEVLRKYPVAFGNGRTAAKDFNYEGFKIRKGEDLLVFTTATHFDEDYFPEPEAFETSRYSGEESQHRQRYAFNPYGRGPHICLGAAMAESMMLTTVATLLHHYRFEAVKPGKRYGMIFDPSPTLPSGFRVNVQHA